MPQMAIEEIEAVRGGERSVWFAGVKGFILSLVKEAIPTILVGLVAGAVIAGAGLIGMEILQGTSVLEHGAESFLKEGGTMRYMGLVSLTSGALSGLFVGAKGAYSEVKHARSINHLIDMEVESVKGRAHSRLQQASQDIAAERPDYIQKIIEKGADASPHNQLAKLLKERELAESNTKITLH